MIAKLSGVLGHGARDLIEGVENMGLLHRGETMATTGIRHAVVERQNGEMKSVFNDAFRAAHKPFFMTESQQPKLIIITSLNPNPRVPHLCSSHH
jgi:hypothetical protein